MPEGEEVGSDPTTHGSPLHESERLTLTEAARLLGVHPNTIRKRSKSGSLRAHKVVTENGMAYVLSRQDLGLGGPPAPTTVVPSPGGPSPSHQPLPDFLPMVEAAYHRSLVAKEGEIAALTGHLAAKEELIAELRRRAAVAEERAAQLERTVRRQQRPWWLRLLG